MSAPPGISTNPFETLGLDRSASFEDVKLAYRRLARAYHPDANPNDPTALERFTGLRRAYDRLKIFYQTLDDVGPAATRAPSAAESPAPPPALLRVVHAPGRPGSATGMTAPDRAARAAGGAPPPAPRPRGTAEPMTPGADDRYDSMPEPSIATTGNRRAFRRTGPMRQSGDIARRTGDIGRQSGEIGEVSAAPPIPINTARPSAVRLPAPLQVGGGNLAMRGEIVFGHPAVAPSDDPQMVYALIGLRASDGVVFPRVPLNLCLVLDHSSSMLRGGKVDRLKETVRGIVQQLDDEDYLSIVSFGDRAEVLLPAQPLNDKSMVHGAIEAMRCRGGTEISRGLAAGLSELSRNASRGLSHLILLTDGQTYGDELICLERAEEAAGMGVGITTYGLGADWNSALLDGIAGPTGGYSDYIESPEAMAQAFTARVTALQSTTLRKVLLTIHPAGGCTVRRATLVGPLLRPLEHAIGSGVTTSVLGDMSGNTDYRVLMEFVLSASRPGKIAIAEVTLQYDVPGLQRDGESLHIPLSTVAKPDRDARAPIDPRVTEALRNVTVHRLQQQAWGEINNGDAVKGTGLLKRAAEHLELAGHAELAAVAATEAARVEDGNDASDENVKRIIYGTRKLG